MMDNNRRCEALSLIYFVKVHEEMKNLNTYNKITKLIEDSVLPVGMSVEDAAKWIHNFIVQAIRAEVERHQQEPYNSTSLETTDAVRQ
jgi:hypothetical protein